MTFGQLADGFNRYFAVVTAGIAALSGFVFSVKSMIAAQGELSDSLADIRKTTGMTADEVEKLNKKLGEIDTRTSRQDLREIAVVAGQLGIAKDDVFSFVDSVDKLNVALGDEIKGGAEEVASQMGKLRNVLTDMKSANVSDDMLRLGNAVNELGAAGFATAPVVVDFASRIGGVGISLGLTSDEVLGLSATLQELNVSTERGGTAVVKILQKMTTEVDTFAGVAGMSTKDFKDLLNRDLFSAFIKVMEGSKRSGQSATELSAIIKDLEVQGAGASEVFAKFGNSTDMLREKVKLAGGALQGTDSIMNEFNIKNATLGAVLAKLQKDFYSLITLPGVTEFFKNQVFHVVQLVNWLKDLPLTIEKYRIAIIAVAGATGVWIAAKTRSLQVSFLNNVTMKEGILLKAKDAIMLELLIAKEKLWTVWKGEGTVATKAATAAQYLWNAAVKANPLGLLIMAITAVVAAIKAYDKYNAESVRNEQVKASTMERMASVNKTLSDNYDSLNQQIRTLNRLSVTEKQDLEDKINKNIRLAESELALMKVRQNKIREDNSKPSLWQRATNAVMSGANPMIAAVDNAVDGANNGNEAAASMNDGIAKLEENLRKLRDTKSQLNEITRAESIADGIAARTIEALQEKLGKYQTALRNATVGSEEYNRIQEKIKKTNAELAKADNGETDGGQKKKVKTEYEKLNEEIQKYNEMLQKEILDNPAHAKVIAEKIQRLKDYKNAIDQAVQSLMAQQELETGAIKGMAPKKYDPNKGLGHLSKAPDIMSKVANPEPADAGTPQGALGVDMWGQKADQFMGYANTVVNGLMSIDQMMSSRENAQLARDSAFNDEKKKNLKRQLDAKKISQATYDAQISKMDLEMDAKKRDLQIKQARRQKALSLAQAIISTAQAVTSALSAGPIIGIVLAALVGILGAIQIGYIASQPIPQAMRGRYAAILKARQAAMGRYDVLGQEDNKLYRGVPFIRRPESGVYGTPTMFAETGKEIILNPTHTENLMRFRPDLVHAIMHDVPQRAGGSYPQGTVTAPAPQATVVQFHPETIKAMQAFQEALSRPVESTINYDTMMTSIDRVDKIKATATR
jgi:TP901 family phage tail tape measure protein